MPEKTRTDEADGGPWENPLGLAGVEFIEFSAFSDHEVQELTEVFKALGFAEAGHHRSKDVTWFHQGEVNFVLNREPDSFARSYAIVHGLSVCAMGFRVQDSRTVVQRAVAHGAHTYEERIGPGEIRIPAIRGVYGSLIYLVDFFGKRGSVFDVEFRPPARTSRRQRDAGLKRIDHVSLSVLSGRTQQWVDFYKELFGFHEWSHNQIRDPNGIVVSTVVSSPGDDIHIPINESPDEDTSCSRFLRDYFGEGVQHIAIESDDLFASVQAIEANGLSLLPMPAGFYDELAKSGEFKADFVERIRQHNILVDTEDGGQYLHAYTKPIAGRFYFEIVQRQNYRGFGRKNASVRLEALASL